MDQYYASLARACMAMGDFEAFYTDNMPVDFRVPSLYFPPFESDPSGSAFNSFTTQYRVYAHVYASTRQQAIELAEGIAQGIMLKKCRLPVYKEDGTESGEIIRVENPVARVIDEGVAQITLTYKITRRFTERKYPKTSGVEINKYYD